MKYSNFFIFILAFVSIVIPFPGRLAYGIIVLLQVTVLCALGLALQFLIGKLKIPKLESLSVLMLLIIFSVLFYQFLILYSPLIALTLSFSHYLVCFSSFLFGLIFSESNDSFKTKFSSTMMRLLFFTAFALLFFIIRDIFGYGTLTLPVPSGLWEIVLFEKIETQETAFWASIPAAFMLLAIFSAIFSFFEYKLKTLLRSKNC